MPSHYYAAFAQWHRLSLLKDARTLGELRQLVRHAERPQEIEDLIHLIEADLGYELYQAISKTKLQLSAAERTTFHFKAGDLDISADVPARISRPGLRPTSSGSAPRSTSPSNAPM